MARVDSWQRNHPIAGYPLGVVRMHSDVDGGRHAALMTYYGFLSIIPILLLLVAVLSRVLSNNPELRAELIDSVVPPDLQATVDNALLNLPDGGIPLAIGLVGLIGTGLGVVFTAADTLNDVACVPHRLRSTGAKRYLKALAMLIVLMAGITAIGFLSAWIAGMGSERAAAQIAQVAALVGVVFALLIVGARLLLPMRPSFEALWRPAAIGSAVIAICVSVAALLVPRLIERSGPVYGTFATIIGSLAFIALVCRALSYTAVAATVSHQSLWPRSLDRNDSDSVTDADERALELLARVQERLPHQRVSSTLMEKGS